MTANLSWQACGSSSDGTYLYYGKSTIVTGTPISGTGWTLYTGAPLANTASSATISGLDDNVEYNFNIYCHCSTSGNGPIQTQGPSIKYVCPTVTIVNTTFNSINYNLSVPATSNNTGTWIQAITVTLYDSSGSTLLYTNTHSSPLSTSINGSFTTLSPSTSYTLKVAYSNTGNTRSNICTSQVITTNVSCSAPTLTITNITNSSFDVAYSPINAGDTFDILLNSNAVATGLTVSPYTVTGLTVNTAYTIAVRRNCITGGNAISSTSNVTTSNTSTCTTEVSSLQIQNVSTSAITVSWINPSNSTGNSLTYRACGSTTWLIPNASGNYPGIYAVGGSGPGSTVFQLNSIPIGTCLEFLVKNSCGTPTSYSNGTIVSGTTLLGTIGGNITLTGTNGTSSGNTVLTFAFSQPTPAGGLVLYFGQRYLSGGTIPYATGYDLFTLTPPTIGDPSITHPNLPWVANIPGGVSTYSITSTLSVLTQTTPDCCESWRYWPALGPVTDMYVKVHTPTGYGANFVFTNSGITTHNV